MDHVSVAAVAMTTSIVFCRVKTALIMITIPCWLELSYHHDGCCSHDAVLYFTNKWRQCMEAYPW